MNANYKQEFFEEATSVHLTPALEEKFVDAWLITWNGHRDADFLDSIWGRRLSLKELGEGAGFSRTRAGQVRLAMLNSMERFYKYHSSRNGEPAIYETLRYGTCTEHPAIPYTRLKLGEKYSICAQIFKGDFHFLDWCSQFNLDVKVISKWIVELKRQAFTIPGLSDAGVTMFEEYVKQDSSLGDDTLKGDTFLSLIGYGPLAQEVEEVLLEQYLSQLSTTQASIMRMHCAEHKDMLCISEELQMKFLEVYECFCSSVQHLRTFVESLDRFDPIHPNRSIPESVLQQRKDLQMEHKYVCVAPCDSLDCARRPHCTCENPILFNCQRGSPNWLVYNGLSDILLTMLPMFAPYAATLRSVGVLTLGDLTRSTASVLEQQGVPLAELSCVYTALQALQLNYSPEPNHST